MKKYIVALVLALILVAGLNALPAQAQTATSTSISTSGGYMYACWYIKAFSKEPCVDSLELQQTFLLDREYHSFVIGNWFSTWRGRDGVI